MLLSAAFSVCWSGAEKQAAAKLLMKPLRFPLSVFQLFSWNEAFKKHLILLNKNDKWSHRSVM